MADRMTLREASKHFGNPGTHPPALSQSGPRATVIGWAARSSTTVPPWTRGSKPRPRRTGWRGLMKVTFTLNGNADGAIVTVDAAGLIGLATYEREAGLICDEPKHSAGPSTSIDVKRSDPATEQPPGTTRRVAPLLANGWSHDRRCSSAYRLPRHLSGLGDRGTGWFWDCEEGREYRVAGRLLTTASGGVEARVRAQGARGAQRDHVGGSCLARRIVGVGRGRRRMWRLMSGR
jgi:hypothetical protein